MKQGQREKGQIERRGKLEKLYICLGLLAMLGIPLIPSVRYFYYFSVTSSQEITEGTILGFLGFTCMTSAFAFFMLFIGTLVLLKRYTDHTKQLKRDWVATYGVSAFATVTEQMAVKYAGSALETYRLEVTWAIPGAAAKRSFGTVTPSNRPSDFALYPVGTKVGVLYDPDDPSNYLIRWEEA